MHRLIRRELLVFAIVLTGACGNDNTVTIPTPTTPTVVTDTLTGVLTRNGATTFPFAVPSAGTVTAILASLTPNSTLVIGLGIGTWNGAACQMILANDRATQGTAVTGNISSAGNLCVRVYDAVGNIVDPQSYQINVTHP